MFVIQSMALQFWSGKRWSNEYPNAEQFKSQAKATAVAKKLGDSMVWEHYGENNERTVWPRDIR